MTHRETTAREQGQSRVRRMILGIIAFWAVSAFFVVVLEGTASSLLFLHALWRGVERPVMAERRHTGYDPELGWVGLPNVRIDDMYGPGEYLATNDLGFRGDQEVSRQTPAGRLRMICLGDSFTFGYGVANDETWCAQIAALDRRWETVNMGQGGYGVDQAFLWYARDGADLESQVSVFAFIGDDFFRMQSDHFLGYGKPVLALDEGALTVSNTPVPERRYLSRWLAQNAHLFANLRVIELANRVARRMGAGASEAETEASREETWRVAAAVFDELAARNETRGGRLVLLFLPAPWDYDTDLYDDWRQRVGRYSERTGVPFIDLVEELRTLDRDEAMAFFIPYGQIGAPHLNESGNRWVARHVLDRLHTWYEPSDPD